MLLFLKQRIKLVALFLLFSIACNQQPDKPNKYGWQRTGSAASDLLNADKYTRLVIEIQNIQGYRLDPVTLDNLTHFLDTICSKPGGISIRESTIQLPVKADTLSLEQVIAIEKKYRRCYTHDHTLVIHILVTNGHSENGPIAGLAYFNTSIVIYGKTIESAYLGNEQQTFVLEHEFGHIMGLVNCGTPMQVPHEDTAHVYHCSDPHCMMSYGSGSTQLDSNCRKDLQAMRYKKK